VDTPLWTLPDGTTTCADLVTAGTCGAGALIDAGSGLQQGKAFNYPENNCCACGAGQIQDTEQSFIGGTCTHKSFLNKDVEQCKVLSKYGCDEKKDTCQWVNQYRCALKAGATENERPCALLYSQVECEASMGSNCEWKLESHTNANTAVDQNAPAAGTTCDEE